MGYYIQAPTNHGKADYLVKTHNARIVGYNGNAPAWDENEAIICVVDNGGFEAAGYAFSPRELAKFALPDRGSYQRPRIWLKMNKELAQKLSGFNW